MRTSIDGLAGASAQRDIADSAHVAEGHLQASAGPAGDQHGAQCAGTDITYMANSLADHIAIRFGNDVPQGLNPDGILPAGQSRMRNERGHIDGVKHFNTTCAQNEAGKAYLHHYQQLHPKYSLFGSNCVDNVEGTLRAEKIKDVPSAKEHLSPLNYFNAVPSAASQTPSPDFWRAAKSHLGK